MKRKMKQRLAVLVVCALLTSVFPVGNPVTGKAESETAGSGNYGLNNPIIDPASGSQELTVWDCVWFGNYWQEDTNGDGVADQNDAKQPIKWRVLSVDGDDAFLLADKNLDCRPYNVTDRGVTWETCTMRSWLNGYGLEENIEGRDYSSNNSFLANAFSAEEQSAIQITNVVNNDVHDAEGGNDTQDKVYLLSLDEVTNPVYRFSPNVDQKDENRRTENTGYARAQGADGVDGRGYWWLRSPGITSNYAASVYYSGHVRRYGILVHSDDVVVRPALHLNLSSTSSWSYAGKVYWTGEEPQMSPTSTVKPTNPAPAKKPNAKSNASSSTATSIGKVSSLKLKQKKHTITVSWKRVSNATGYIICYSTSNKWKNKKLKQTKKNKITIKKLKKKKTYYFCVCAYQKKGTSKVYGSWSKVKKIVMKK